MSPSFYRALGASTSLEMDIGTAFIACRDTRIDACQTNIELSISLGVSSISVMFFSGDLGQDIILATRPVVTCVLD